MSCPAEKFYFLSPSDYLEGEKYSDLRHEYEDGQVYAMAGESRAHNTIAGNFYMVLRAALRGSPCRVYMENVKTRIKTLKAERYFYPDVQVVCAGNDRDAYFANQPKVIVEVLSDSTERRDRADKLFAYRTLPSLEEYVLVAQDSRRVEVFRRARQWDWELYEDGAEIRLDSLNLNIPLATVYEDVEFPPPPPYQHLLASNSG